MNGIRGEVFKLTDWITKLAYLNMLWIAFTILGLGIFGVIPATVAMFTVTREWISKKSDKKIYQTFWASYRSNFLKSNLFGLVFGAVGVILYIDFVLFKGMEGFVSTLLVFVIASIGIMYIITLLFIFPVFVHFKVKKFQVIKFSLMMSIAYPHITIVMLSAFIILVYLSLLMPVLIVFFSMSLISFTLMSLANKVFMKLEEKKNALQESFS